MIIDKKTGLKLIRQYGLHNFPDIECEYHTVGGGIIAVRDSLLGGKEIHLAFKSEFRANSGSFIIDFCDSLNCTVWALIEEEYSKTINAAFRCGFKYVKLGHGTRLNKVKTNVHVMKRVSK